MAHQQAAILTEACGDRDAAIKRVQTMLATAINSAKH
jgi:hypothetical protein